GGVANAVVPPETGKRFGRAGFRRLHTGAVVRVPRGDVLKLEGLATPRGSPLDFRRGNQVSIEGHVVKVGPIVAINLDGPCTVPRVVLGARFTPVTVVRSALPIVSRVDQIQLHTGAPTAGR